MARRVEGAPPPPTPAVSPAEPTAGPRTPSMPVADPARRREDVRPPPKVTPRGSERLFASAGLKKKIPVTFERDGRHHEVSLDLPLQADGITRGRWSSGVLAGEYETRLLPNGGAYYHLAIDKTGATTLPNGQPIFFREGVVGFRNDAKSVSFQAETGRRIATGAPVHAPPDELFLIAGQLHVLALGESFGGVADNFLDFLRDETDLGLLTATLNFVLDPKLKKETGNWRAEKVVPVFANPYIGRAEQKAILIALIESAGSRLLSERFYRLGRIDRTLASQEAFFELALELTGPTYQKNPELGDRARETAYLRGIELLAFLSPVKAGPSLPDDELLQAVDLALTASTSSHAMRRLAAYKSLVQIVPTLRTDFDRRAAARVMARICTPEWTKLIESDEALAKARVFFLTRFAMQGGPMGLSPSDAQALDSAITLQLEKGIVTTAVAFSVVESFLILPAGDLPFRESQTRLARVFARRMKELPIVEHVDHFPVRIRDKVAQMVLGRRGDASFMVDHPRANLYRIITEEDPDWTKNLTASLAMDIELRFGRRQERDLLTLADLDRWLSRDRRRSLFFDFDEPPSGLRDALRSLEWRGEERTEILERLLAKASRCVSNPVFGDDWVEVAYLFAERYGLNGRFYSWLDSRWTDGREAALVVAVGRGLDGPARDPEVRRRLAGYAREMVDAGRLKEPGGVEALRQVVLSVRGSATEGERALAERLLTTALDEKTIPKEGDESGYSLHLRVNDLGLLEANGLVPKGRMGGVADFYARAFSHEPPPEGLFPSATRLRDAARSAGIKTPKLDSALNDFAYLGHIPAHATMSGQRFFDTVTSSADRDERVRAAEEGKFIVLNREFVRARMRGKPFNPSDEESLRLLEAGLGIAMHDHAGAVAEGAERSYAYAVAVLAPPSEPGGEVKPVLIVRDGKPTARPNKKSDWRVFALDVTGTISTESIASAREALTMLPRQHTARFLGVEGHTRDPQRHSSGLREMVHPEGGSRGGRPVRYTMRIYDRLDLDTAVHAVIHPVWDSLSWEDQRGLEALHRASRDPADFAEPYGMTDPMEDFVTLGTAWVRDSEKTLRTAVDMALKGHPIPLQKLLVFLKGYSAGSATLPAHKFEGDEWAEKIRNAGFAFQRLPMSEITQITAGGTTFSFGYTGSTLTSVNGRNLAEVPVVPLGGTRFEPPFRDPSRYHPK